MNRTLYTVRLLLSLIEAAWSAPGNLEGLSWLRSMHSLIALLAEGDYAGAREILKHMEAEHPPFTE